MNKWPGALQSDVRSEAEMELPIPLQPASHWPQRDTSGSLFLGIFFARLGHTKRNAKWLDSYLRIRCCTMSVWAWNERCYSESKLGGRTKPSKKRLVEKPQDPFCFKGTEDKAVRGQSMVWGSCISVKDMWRKSKTIGQNQIIFISSVHRKTICFCKKMATLQLLSC